MSGATGDAWFISQEERTRHENQFNLLKPIDGRITGAIARQFFIKSGLPTQILATIWEIADGDKDGMLDKSEFSVAMHLIQRKLQGLDVPLPLPLPRTSTTTAPALLTNGYAPSNGVQMTPYPTPMVPALNPNSISSLTNTSAPIGTHNNSGRNWLGPSLEPYPSASSSNALTSRTTPLPYLNNTIPSMSGTLNMASSLPTGGQGVLTSASLSADWSIPHNVRLRSNQVFMSLDKEKTGYLSGVQAKNVLLQTQLPQQVLAQIWNLADIDLDGRLSLEEFTLATYLCEQYKTGCLPVLPSQLPPDLVPPSYRSISQLKTVVNGFEPRMTNGNHVPSQITMAQSNSTESSATQAESQAKNKPLPTYEDRRKENFDRGAAILEQKRSAILAAERAEREARERKEAEERERVERQRQERERKKQQELEMAKEREKEVERQADMEKIKVLRQKEAARQELEKKRKEDRVAITLEELESKLRRERASLAALKTTSRDLECENQNMGEKVSNVEQTLKDTVGVRDKLQQSKQELDAKCEEARSRLSTAQREVENARLRLQELTYQKGKAQLAAGNSGLGQTSAEAQKQALQSSIVSLKRQLSVTKNDANAPHINYNLSNDSRPGPAEPAKDEDPFGMPGLSTHNTAPFSQTSADPFGQDLFAQPTKQPHKSVDSKMNAEGKPGFGDGDPFASGVPGRHSLPGAPADALAAELKEKMNIKRKSLTASAITSTIHTITTTTSANTTLNAAADPFVPHPNSNRTQVKISTETVTSNLSSSATSDPSKATNDSTKLCPYKALFQFDSRSEDEISFKPDDIILVAEDETSEPGWLGGKIGDKVGWFPAAYTQKITSTNNNNNPNNVVRQVSIPFLTLGNIPEETSSAESHIYQEPSELRKIAGAEGDTKMRQGDGVMKAVAIYPLQSTTEGDLSFAQGDIMTINQEPDSNWWIATMGAKSGYVPKSYVKILSDPNSSRPSSTPAIRPPAAGNQNSSYIASTGNISRSEATSPTGDRRNSSNLWTSPAPDPSPALNSVLTNDSSWAAFDAPNPAPTLTATAPKTSAKTEGSGGLKYIAVYPYASTEVGDLAFKPGDVILVEEGSRDSSSNADWWTGMLLSTGAKGTFPSNYVTKMADTQTQPPLTNAQKFQHQRKSSTGSMGSVISESASHKSSGGSKKSAGPMETVIAIAPFTASGPEQMCLTPGMILSVRRKTPTGWWEGEVVPKTGQGSGKKQIGWFPGSHVKPVKATSLNDPERRIGSAWAKPSGGSQSGTTPSAIHSPAQQPIVYAVKALFDYASNHDGDLSFKQGELIHVTEKNDANWWTGRSASTNQIGLFPSNYVSPVSVISTYDPSNPIA